MIAKLVSYQLPADLNREQVIEMAKEVAEKWLQHPKLIRKDFLLDENNVTYGYYLFPDRESAEAAHGDDFLQRLENNFGVKPQIKYFDYLLTADAGRGLISGLE